MLGAVLILAGLAAVVWAGRGASKRHERFRDQRMALALAVALVGFGLLFLVLGAV